MKTGSLLFLSRKLGRLVVVGLCFATSLRAGTDADKFAGTNLLAGATFVRSGGSSLTRTNLTWQAPTNLSHPALVFAFGFASDETFTPGEFLDAFSITLRNADRSFIAPLLTADLLGVTIAPANPDGHALQENSLQLETLGFPPVGASFRFQQSALVMVMLPNELIGRSGTLGISLFDNLNTSSSLGFVSHLAVVPGPGTLLVLESSASAGGPYAIESGLTVSHARQMASLARPGFSRFYRLRSGATSRITSFRPEAANWAITYSGAQDGLAPILESSAQALGPYATEAGVTADLGAQLLRVPRDGAARFYRIRSEIPLTIRSLGFATGKIHMHYEETQP